MPRSTMYEQENSNEEVPFCLARDFSFGEATLVWFRHYLLNSKHSFKQSLEIQLVLYVHP